MRWIVTLLMFALACAGCLTDGEDLATTDSGLGMAIADEPAWQTFTFDLGFTEGTTVLKGDNCVVVTPRDSNLEDLHVDASKVTVVWETGEQKSDALSLHRSYRGAPGTDVTYSVSPLTQDYDALTANSMEGTMPAAIYYSLHAPDGVVVVDQSVHIEISVLTAQPLWAGPGTCGAAVNSW